MKRLLTIILCILLLTGCAQTYDGPTIGKSVLSREETTYYDPSGESVYTRREYTYDIYGNQTQILESSYLGDSEEPQSELKTVMRCDEAGNVIRQRLYDLSGWLPKKLSDTRHEYDDRGRMISGRYNQGFGWEDTTIVYDDGANKRTTIGFGSTIVEYLDENGWVVRSESVFADGEPITEEYERRPDGQVLTIRTYQDGVLRNTTEYTYDDQGRPLTWTSTEDGVSAACYSWEYGDTYEKFFYPDGSWTATDFSADGIPHARMTVNADGTVRENTVYRYTEIRVPAGEGGAQ